MAMGIQGGLHFGANLVEFLFPANDQHAGIKNALAFAYE